MHTNYSDGRWPAGQLIDYLVSEGFAMVCGTDHDCVDTVAGTEALPAKRQHRAVAPFALSPILAAASRDLLSMILPYLTRYEPRFPLMVLKFIIPITARR